MSIFAHIISTQYSNDEAFGVIDEYVDIIAQQAKESGEPEPAIILADKFSTTAQIPFFNACQKKGVKPVFGLKIVVQGKDGSDNHELILVAKNDTGRQNLNRITTEAYKMTPEKGYKLITREQMESFKDGLICISGGTNGLIEKEIVAGNYNGAKRVASYLKKVFNNDFYLQVQRNSSDLDGKNRENLIIDNFKKISDELDIKIVASNDVRFAKKEYYKYHLTRKAIIESELIYNPAKRHNETENQYLIPTAHMIELFKDIPSAVYNMGDLVDSTDISDFKNRLGKSCLPKFPIPEEFNDDPVAYLTHLSEEGLANRWSKIEQDYRKILGKNDDKGNLVTEEFIAKTKTEYQERVAFELETIKNTGFAGYFLIVHELVNWCKENDIPVGPGRGSGAGSLVLYSLNITDIDPIPYDLLFERFLNPERMSEPDIDIDFSPKNRERVIKHMKELYGEENTAQILTEGTLAARSAIDSVGRVRGLSPQERERIKSLIPETPGSTIKTELEMNEKMIELYEKSRQNRAIINEALRVEGHIVSYGKHAGGVVISLGAMEQYAALYREEGENSPVVQMDKNLCEKIGLIKFDILGLKNLDIIHECVKAINEGRPEDTKLNMDDISLKDPMTINLFKNADTYGIFQFESVGMRRLMKDLNPDNFEEIVALVALFRPGPLQSNMHTDFIERKFNPSKLTYIHPKLENVLEPTKGTIIYQEQVMSIGRVLAGFTLGKADILRKAMGKKDPVIMAEQRIQFLSGCADNFRQETLDTTGSKLKSTFNPEKTVPVDIIFEDVKYEPLLNIVKDTDFKFTKIDQVTTVLKEFAGLNDDDIKLFKLEVDNMEDKTYYRKFYNNFMQYGVEKLKNDGVNEEDAHNLMARTAIATSIFVRFNRIFSLMDKFAAYGFNKSHSVAYAKVSFQTAYLKAHYPSQYMAAMLSNESNIENLSSTLTETRRMGLNIIKPDINLSEAEFKAVTNDSKEKNIIFGLDQIKGINKSVQHLVRIRKESGKIKDIFDFYDKFGTYKIKDEVEQLDGTVKTSNKTLIGKTVLNNLINAGVLDSLCPNGDPKYRTTLQATYHYLEEVVKDINKRLKSNYQDINKKLKIHFSNNEIDSIMKKVTGTNDYQRLFVPENISEMNANLINKAYEALTVIVNEQATKKTEFLNLKPVNDYHEEVETFKPDVKKIKIEQNGKTVTYIEPTSLNYNDVPLFGTKEAASLEHSLTGMYLTKTPLDLGNIKQILLERGLKCSTSKELPQEINTFGTLNEKTNRRYWQSQFAGTIVEIKDFKRFNNETGESYIDITATVDDGLGNVTVKFNADKIFTAGKEQRGIDMLKEMIKKDVLVVEGSATVGSYESAGVTIFAKKIGSTNPDLYLPVEDPSFNFVENENEQINQKKQSQDLASSAQIHKLESLLKKNNVSYKELFDKYNIDEIGKLKKYEASELIQKYIDNNKPSL